MPVDYEVEYDNRSRVPEHPEIFARWQREAAAYRASAHNPKLGIGYGPSSRRTMDLFPAKDDDKAPLAMFIPVVTGARLSLRCFHKWRQDRMHAG
jgi:arylformamidase